MNFKETLNLPKTTFPMKANLSGLEPRILDLWKGLDIYSRMLKERVGRSEYILHDGPPYANGTIHIGHALNKILKDIIIKFQTLNGKRCPFIVGWDCHGLPVEHQLLKELKLTKHDVEVSDFRKKAKDYALKFVSLQRDDFKRLGIFSDWDNPYLTLNFEYEEKVIELLKELTKRGFVYRGRKPVNWCRKCETALAEAEVVYLDKESDSIFLFFPLKDHKGIFSDYSQKINFLVWTTTPWTLVSNVAVAVNPELLYVLVELDGNLLILGQDLVRHVEEKINSKVKVIKTLKGSKLEGIVLNHPFSERETAVVLADFVSNEDGSGCVHIAPGHGMEDFSLTKKYDLDILMPVNDKGFFEEPELFAGKNINQANEIVISSLKDKGRLLKHEKIKHSYPHCWRCDSPIIFRATYQWFINIDHNGLRDACLSTIGQVSWFPASGKERMRSMLTSRPDWCISRQRLWGIPIPAVSCNNCHEVILDESILQEVAKVFKYAGSDSWFVDELSKFLPEDFKCPKCQGQDLKKEFDILDVWFESGASFLSVVKANPLLRFPADMYLEGSDQHRGWFQVSMILAVALEKKAPFKTILTHGFVVDGDGKKMSKSLGNVIAPQKIIKNYGAEILRLWTAYSDYSLDVKISDHIIKQLVDMYRKIRNTIRFTLGNISDFDPLADKVEYAELLEVDKYMLAKGGLFFQETIKHYQEYSFYKVCQNIFNFCNLSLSSFYLDILKDRLYTFPQKSKQRLSAQYVLCELLKILIQLIAPVLSFTAEEAYGAWEKLSDKKDSVFITEFEPEKIKSRIDHQLLKKWERILDFRTLVLKEIEKKREEGIIGSSLDAEVLISCESEMFKTLTDISGSLNEVFIVSNIRLNQGKEEIIVTKAKGEKCPRCWNWSDQPQDYEQFSGVCPKCIKSLKEA